MNEFGGEMRCGDEIREDGVAPVPVGDTHQQAHKSGPKTRRPHQDCPAQRGINHPKNAREFEGRALIGAEGTVSSWLVSQKSNRNQQREQDLEREGAPTDWADPKELPDFKKRRVLGLNALGRNQYCGAFSIEGKSFDGSETKYLRVNCKCWDCPYCGPRKAKQYRYSIRGAAQRHGLCRFLTLTLDPKKVTGEPIAYLRLTFNRFRARLHKRFGHAPSYIAVVELQKNGNPHLHVLIDRYIEQRWLKSVWEEIGGGFMVDIKFVDVHRVSAYVSKYLTKELLLSAQKGTRRITCSRSIKLIDKGAKTHAWTLHKTPIFELYQRLIVLAANVQFDEEQVLFSFSITPMKGHL